MRRLDKSPFALFVLSSLALGACSDDTTATGTAMSMDGTVSDTDTDTDSNTDSASETSDSGNSGDGDGDDPATATASGDGDGDSGDGDGDSGDGDGDSGDGDGDSGDGDGDSGDGDGDSGDGDGDVEFCPMGEIICEDGVAFTCDGMGGFSDEVPCADECVPELGGCVLCVPGTGYCEGDQAFSCDPDGQGHSPEDCDSLQGIMCDENSGECVGECTDEVLGNSYIGCDYFPTITPNPLLQNTNIFRFAVAVANTTNNDSTVTVTRGDNQVDQVVVASNSVEIIELPWIDALRTGGNDNSGSKTVVDGAYRLRSTHPVTVYQYNPLQYTANNQFSFTNDASLLLPTNTWRDEVRVVGWNHFALADWSSFYAVVASEDDTNIELDPSATGGWIRPGAGVQANGTGNVTLDESDVLIVFSAAANGNAALSDPSGTLVNADKPIQVLGGHVCIYIPESDGFCDHIEESVPPLDTVGKDYFVTVPLINPPNQTKPRMVRIVATEDNTMLSYEPAVNGAPNMLANAGDVATITTTTADFRITSPNKILVSEYMQGQESGGNKGDPAMTLAVPVEQFRTSYLIHAPTNYTDSLANVVAPDGANITVDGDVINDWTPIGNSGYSVARVVLSNNGDGNHDFAGDEEFGIQIYGYGQFTSYWYPGGQDLNLVPQ